MVQRELACLLIDRGPQAIGVGGHPVQARLTDKFQTSV
jgi:hypothetical protein